MNAPRVALALCFALSLVVATRVLADDDKRAVVDLRQAVPADAYMAIHAQHNPERDYQRAYVAEIWQTVQDEKLIERVSAIIANRVKEKDLDAAKSVAEELKTAVAPIDLKSLCNAKETVFAQEMDGPFNYHLVLVRLTPEVTAGCEQGVKNLYDVIVQHAGDKVSVSSEQIGTAAMTTLHLPPGAPYSPTIVRAGDVLLFASSDSLARRSLAMLQGSGEPSKFSDPRLMEALKKLPEPEDALVFFDGRQLFSRIRSIGQFIRDQKSGDPKADRAASMMEKIVDEVSILDYAVTSESTDGQKNCKTSLLKMMADADSKALASAVEGGQPFEHWEQLVPADAVSYSLSTGVNLHPIYERVIAFLHDNLPESAPALDKFAKVQEKLGVQLDDDILQAFSGEQISISLPGDSATSGHQNVVALRCQKPERIHELLHKLVDAVQQFPAVKAQQVQLVECKDLDGFEEISASMLALVGKRPVIGFHDGWMIIGSEPKAVERLLDTWSGKSPGIDQSAQFQRFGVKFEGPVRSVGYNDVAENIRHVAQSLDKAGVVASMFVGMAAAKVDKDHPNPQLETANDLLKLVPSVVKVVEKFDFLEGRLQVTQQGDDPHTYVQRSVTLVRPPAENKSAAGAAAGAEAAPLSSSSH
jgi:hypothetical protein